jgi:hypothetical protein
MSTQAGTPELFTRAEIGGAISRALLLPPEIQGVAELTGRLHQLVNSNPQFRVAGLEGEGFRSLVFSNLPAALVKLLDPAQRAAALQQQAKDANPTGAGSSLTGGLSGYSPFAALRNMPTQSPSASNPTSSSTGVSGASPAQNGRWQLEGTPLRNMTGLDTGVYAQLRGEGYSKMQIGAAAGDLSKVRGFTPTDVSHYTPYFVETSKKFRDETKRVIESNGTKKFEEADSVTEANAQAELHGGHKIEHQQMNALGQLVYDSGINRETLRRQPGEGAKRQFLSDHMRENFNGFDMKEWDQLRKTDPAKANEYKEQHGVKRNDASISKDRNVAGATLPATSADADLASNRMAALMEKADDQKPAASVNPARSTPSENKSERKAEGKAEPSEGKKADVAPETKKPASPAATKEASARPTKAAGPTNS